MGINRSSIFAGFGDKKKLYKAVLERYTAGPMAYVRTAGRRQLFQRSLKHCYMELSTFCQLQEIQEGASRSMERWHAARGGCNRKTMIEWRTLWGELQPKKRLLQAQEEPPRRQASLRTISSALTQENVHRTVSILNDAHSNFPLLSARTSPPPAV